MFDIEKKKDCSEKGSSMLLSNHDFQSEYIWKNLSYEAKVFFQIIPNLV